MIPVWDIGIRVFHWSLVLIVLSNHFVNDSGGSWHEWLGYIACGLIGARLIWGFIGTPFARFKPLKDSWPPRGTFISHTRQYLSGQTPRTMHHPPLAIIGMISMLICLLFLGLTGWMFSWDVFFGEEWLELTHEWLSNILLGLAVLHVLGVVRESYLHRENLIASMIHGKKRP